MQSQCLTDQGVLDGIDRLYPFEFRVLEEVVAGERRVDSQINILSDRGRDDEPAFALVVARKVGPPATDRDSQRGAGDDHQTV